MTALTFAVGDKAVYPAQGVCEVAGIETREIAGIVLCFYCLNVIDTGMRILVPTHKADQVGLRRPMDAQQLAEVLEVLADPMPPHQDCWKRRMRGLHDKLATGSLIEMAEVYRDLCRRADSRSLSFGERRLLDQVQPMLAGEVAASLGCSERAAVKRLLDAVHGDGVQAAS